MAHVPIGTLIGAIFYVHSSTRDITGFASFHLPRYISRMGDTPDKSLRDYLKPEAWGFRWGGGVVSNTTFAIVATFIAMGVICWSLSSHPAFAAAISGGMLLVLVVYLIGNWWFASKHPDLAALGGPEYASVRQRQMGTKENPQIIDAQNVEAPPLLEHEAGKSGA